ncbi:hypothetical protein [Kaarinaea lacus]
MLRLNNVQWYTINWSRFGEQTFGYCFVSCVESLVGFARYVVQKFESLSVSITTGMLTGSEEAKEWRFNEMLFRERRRGIPRRTWRRHSAMLSLMQQSNIRNN